VQNRRGEAVRIPVSTAGDAGPGGASGEDPAQVTEERG